MRARLRIVAVTLLLGGCAGSKVTEIVVSIASDLDIPSQLQVVEFKVAHANELAADGGGATPWLIDIPFDVVDRTKPYFLSLPAEIGLLPAGNPDRTIYIQVTGVANKQPQVRREARLPFARDRIVRVRMNLLKNCLFKPCPPGTTCEDGACVSIDKDPNKLERWDPDRKTWVSFTRSDGGPLDGSPDTVADRPPPDRPGIDLAQDRLPADRPGVEGRPPDMPLLNDLPKPDLPKIDMTRLDQPKDLPKPDARPPDQPRVDLRPPDQPSADLRPPDGPTSTDKPTPWKWDGYVCTQPGPTSSCTGTTPGRWCTVGAGCFMMGTPVCSGVGRAPYCSEGDENYRQVILTHSFTMQATEVTVGQWLSAMGGKDPSSDKVCGADCPVESITWDQAAAYCNTLSTPPEQCYTCTGTGAATSCVIKPNFLSPSPDRYYTCPGYRLPTEAEQEYASRATTTTDYPNGQNAQFCSMDAQLDQIAWYYYNAPKGGKAAVATKAANAWGLFDLTGNVWEWTVDEFFDFQCGQTSQMPIAPNCWDSVVNGLQPSCQPQVNPIIPVSPTGMVVMHGGSFQALATSIRPANRMKQSRVGHGDVGFRCVRTIP